MLYDPYRELLHQPEITQTVTRWQMVFTHTKKATYTYNICSNIDTARSHLTIYTSPLTHMLTTLCLHTERLNKLSPPPTLLFATEVFMHCWILRPIKKENDRNEKKGDWGGSGRWFKAISTEGCWSKVVTVKAAQQACECHIACGGLFLSCCHVWSLGANGLAWTAASL